MLGIVRTRITNEAENVTDSVNSRFDQSLNSVCGFGPHISKNV